MNEKTTITALYDRTEDAQKALRELQNMDISREDISLIASDATGEYGRNGDRNLSTEDDTAEDVVTGATVGGLGGLVVGLATLAIPGIGPVLAAGPIASALVAGGVGAGVGASVGAVAGGVVGALTDLGLSEERAGYYAEGVRRGGTLLTTHVPDNMSSRVMDMLNGYHAVDVEERVSDWRENGWKAYDPNAKPYGAEEIGRERSRYGTDDTTRERNQHGAGDNGKRNQYGVGDTTRERTRV